MAAGATRGPVVEKVVERLARRQLTTASRMARLGAALAPRRSSLPALRRGRRILAGRQRGVARVALQAPLELGDALLLLGEALAQLGDLTPKAERSAPRAPGAQRRPSQAPAQRPPQPRRVPCPRASRRRREGLLMSPRPSPPRWPWVDQLNAYSVVLICRYFARRRSTRNDGVLGSIPSVGSSFPPHPRMRLSPTTARDPPRPAFTTARHGHNVPGSLRPCPVGPCGYRIRPTRAGERRTARQAQERHMADDPVGGRNSLHRAISPTRCRRTAGSPGR